MENDAKHAVDVKPVVVDSKQLVDTKPVVVDTKPGNAKHEVDVKPVVVNSKQVVDTKPGNVKHTADIKPVGVDSKQLVDSKPVVVDTKPSAVESKQFSQPDLPGYVGFANLPNQVHRKSVKKGFEFTLMVVGESGLGKSTLINSLFLSDLYPNRVPPSAAEKINKTVKIEASTVDIEERGVKLHLTVVDTPGFGDAINSSACFQTIVQYVDAQFEKFLKDESGLNRRNIVDTRVHCCFFFISSATHGLKPIDIKFMKSLHHKVNIVPVIAKADMLTQAELKKLKKKLNEEIAAAGIQTYSLPECDDDEDVEYKQQCTLLKEAVPFAVVGSNTVIEVRGRKMRGRMYPWGVVEVENPEHCDFIKLRTLLVTHMQDMQEVTQELHYENYRHQKLASGAPDVKSATFTPSKPEQKVEDVNLLEREKELAEKEAQLKNMQQMLATMQAEMQQKAAAAAAMSKPSTDLGLPPTNKPPPPPVAARKPSFEVPQSRGGEATNNNKHQHTDVLI